jgi:hypothetical protein
MKVLLVIILILADWSISAQTAPFYSSVNDKYGYKDSHGEVVLTPKYDFAWSFKEGMSPVKINGKYGYVNEKGVEVISPKFDHAGMFSDGLSVVKLVDKYGFIDKTGKLVVPAIYDRADNFHGDRANVCLNRKWSVMIYPARK